MKSFKIFVFFFVLGAMFLTSCSEEDVFTEKEMTELGMRKPGSPTVPPCSEYVSINVIGSQWDGDDNTTCPTDEPLELYAVGFAPGDILTWDVQGADVLGTTGTSSNSSVFLDLPGTDTHIFVRVTNQNGLSACISFRVITYGDCFYGGPNSDWCTLFPNHPDCTGSNQIPLEL